MSAEKQAEKQKDERRVIFETPLAVQIMAVDGTWGRSCTLKEVSETEATLVIEGSVQGLNLKEFFLLLSSTGLAYRRCELAWMNGDQMGINFLSRHGKQTKPKPSDFV